MSYFLTSLLTHSPHCVLVATILINDVGTERGERMSKILAEHVEMKGYVHVKMTLVINRAHF